MLVVSESPIDALSCATIDKWNHAPKSHYLALGGTAPLAAVQYLTDHPQIKAIRLCLDNDKAGLFGIEKIKAVLLESTAFSHVKIIPEPPPKVCGKDYNELLLMQIAQRSQNINHRNFER